MRLHLVGSWRASVWLTVMPPEEAPPLTSSQRHAGEVCNTEESAEQQAALGAASVPLTNGRHGSRPINAVEHPLDCAFVASKVMENDAMIKKRETALEAIVGIEEKKKNVRILNEDEGCGFCSKCSF